jgi:hypothetical protein
MLGGMRGLLHESCVAQAGVHMHNMVANEWSVYDASLEIMRALVAALSGETRNLQGTACNLLCNLQGTTCNLQRATCGVQHAACNMCSVQRATCSVQHAACSVQHAACNMQRALVATLSGTAHAMQRRRTNAVRWSASHCTE